MRETVEIEKYIPFDKSWIIRMGVLDILHGYKDIQTFLNKQNNLGDDLLALKRVSETWSLDKPLDVGESGTLFRYLQFAIWKLNLNKTLIKKGTLTKREICNNPEIVNWPLNKLLELDSGTSQWGSASILLGNKEVLKNPPYFLQLTYEALEHWNKKRKRGLVYEIRRDEVLFKQAKAFFEILKTGKTKFFPSNPDDYCFARAFNLIDKEEGGRRFPAVKGHESNRLSEMEKCLEQFENNKIIETNDHRVVQAITMLGIFKNKEIKFSNKLCVSKSWPQFWDFVKFVKSRVIF